MNARQEQGSLFFRFLSLFDRERQQINLARNPQTQESALRQLSQSKFRTVQIAVAKHPNTSAHTLEELAKMGDESLRRAILAHPNISLICLLIFMDDTRKEIRDMAWQRLEPQLTQQRWARADLFTAETKQTMQQENRKAREILLRRVLMAPEIWLEFTSRALQFQVQNFVMHESDNFVRPLTETPFWFALAIYYATSQNASDKNSMSFFDLQLALDQISLGQNHLAISDVIVMHLLCDTLWIKKEKLLDELKQLQGKKKALERVPALLQDGRELAKITTQIDETQQMLTLLDTQIKTFSALSPMTRILRAKDVSALSSNEVGNPNGLDSIICALNARGLQKWLDNNLMSLLLEDLGEFKTIVGLLEGMYISANRQPEEDLRYQGFRFILQNLQGIFELAQNAGGDLHGLGTKQQTEMWNTLRVILDGLEAAYSPRKTSGPKAKFQAEYGNFISGNIGNWINNLVKEGLGIRVIRPTAERGDF